MQRTGKFLASALPAALAVALPLGATPAAAAADNTVVGADVIAEVQPLAYNVTAVAIRYQRTIDLEGATVPTSAFDVQATLRGQGTPVVRNRTVTRVYTNDEPERAATGEKGKYLILELATSDAGAAATYFSFAGFLTELYPLAGAYSVTQTADVLDGRGRLELDAPSSPIVNTGVVSPVVDDFSREAYTSPGGTSVRYRFFAPEAYRDKPRAKKLYPLVLALHGVGERGTNNTSQIVGNQLAYAFAEPGRQSTDPSFVIAPQAPAVWAPGTFIWNPADLQQALLDIVDRAVATYPIDPDRVYLTGLSMGSIGSWELLPKVPRKFAAALLVTGQGDPAKVGVLKDLPLWATHSVDDPTVQYSGPISDRALVEAIEAAGGTATWREWAGNLSRAEANAKASEQVQAARAAGSPTLFTTYSRGTTPVNAHWSWVPTYQNDVMLDWLFSHERTGSASCSASVSTSSWDGGFSATVRVTNTGTKPVAGWSVGLSVAGGVSVAKAWPGTLTQDGTSVSIAAPASNSTVQPGKTLTLGFTASGSPAGASGVTLDGAACG
ncbi:cellulose binding domain-containing protein [Motilibacter aurantiacus]|uniref:cellulose binding domain-containing protein n=1 Tax=Motilibacter aurantiacus TaxID=2714955 RepID=UPI00140DD4C1|nr:cellulose binding domain-containing protein [Motilibacter aurantiacus]NHC44308.1 phospholipase [Motilibacter aurantiacus]